MIYTINKIKALFTLVKLNSARISFTFQSIFTFTSMYTHTYFTKYIYIYIYTLIFNAAVNLTNIRTKHLTHAIFSTIHVELAAGTTGQLLFKTLSREFECEVARSSVTASRSGLHCTTASHFCRPDFFFFRLKKQQHLQQIVQKFNLFQNNPSSME